MTKGEILDVVQVLAMAYPDKLKAENIAPMATAWFAYFKDDEASVVEAAVAKHVATSQWLPSIAEIRNHMVDIFHPELIPPDVAWASVVDVLESSSQFSSRDEFKFPPMIARVIDTIGWHHLKELRRGSYGGQRDGFDRVAFMDLYKPAYERARQEAGLPKALRATITKAAQLSPDTTQYLQSTQEARRKSEEDWYRIMHRSYDALDAPETPNLLEDKK